MADCEVEEGPGRNWIMTKTLPDIKVSNIPQELTTLVHVQSSPQLLQTFQCPRNLKPLLDSVWICPLVFVDLTPGTSVHHSSQGLVKLLV